MIDEIKYSYFQPSVTSTGDDVLSVDYLSDPSLAADWNNKL